MSFGSLLSGVLGGSNPLFSFGISALTGGLGGMVMDFAKQVVSQIARMAIDGMNLPPMVKQWANDAIESVLGEGLRGNPMTAEGIAEAVSTETGMELSEAQTQVDQLQELMDQMMESFMENERETLREQMGAGRTAKEGSWIMLMAVRLGEAIDKQFMEVEAKIAEVNRLSANKGDTVSTGHKLSGAGKEAERSLPGATAEMQGAIQEFNMLMNSVSNAIKTAGQAAGAMASK